jgi:hypothetical protein
MSNMTRTRLKVEVLEGRTVPSAVFDGPPAFAGLNVAVSRFAPVDPCRCLTVSPAFALNYGTPNTESLPALNGLSVAAPTDPCRCVTMSPVFYGLANLHGGSVDAPQP